MEKVYSLPPVYNKDSKILILGTIPSIASRNKNFYYSHPNNRFWKIMEHLFKINLISIQDKINFLLNNNIALWDTIKECEIYKSKDSSIKNVKINDIKSILDETNIKNIYVTGKTALKIYNKYIKNTACIDAIYLPCPSSANASYSLEKLINIYNIILNNLTIKGHYNNGGKKMEKVPNMISTKDLLYIGDMFNWNMISAKKYELFLNEIQDEECSKMINKLCNMHYQICADLTDLLEEGDK